MTTMLAPQAESIRDALEQVAQFGILGGADARLFDIGTDEYLRYFESEVLDDLVRHGGSTCKFFEGSYGAGKTHLLHLLSSLALERGMITVQTVLSHDLALEDWHAITKHIFHNMVLQIGTSRMRGLPRILEAIKETDWVSPSALRVASLPHAGFKNALFRAIVEPDIPMALAHYLSGERMTARQLQMSGISGVKDPLSKRNAELVLATVVGGLFHLGIPGTMLLFDENEKTLDSSRGTASRKVSIAANLMRRLIDGSMNGGLIGTTVVFAILPGFLDNCARLYPALGQRVHMVRDPEQPVAWRWPVLPVESVSHCGSREDFVQHAAMRFTQLVEKCGGDGSGLFQALNEAGTTVLYEQAGSGFRRSLMKRLATLSLERLDIRGDA